VLTLPPEHRPAGDDGRATVHLTIVRHARAGSKRGWDRPDEQRPLDDIGRADAAALAALLAARPVARLVSSPAQRCVQTLRPLAETTGVEIETWPALGPHAGPAALRATLGHPAFDEAVVCTHGELLRPLLRTLRRRGIATTGLHGHGRHLLAKGSAWVLTIEPDGTVAEFQHLAPSS
jgi:phosphohistidine phosphatase SixA